MANHHVVRVCAIAATIGICSITALAEPISMSAKLNTVAGMRSQPNSAFLLSSANSLSAVGIQSETSATSFLPSANMPHYTGTLDKTRTALSVTPGVPEPSAILLFGSGLLTALGYRAKRRLNKSK